MSLAVPESPWPSGSMFWAAEGVLRARGDAESSAHRSLHSRAPPQRRPIQNPINNPHKTLGTQRALRLGDASSLVGSVGTSLLGFILTSLWLSPPAPRRQTTRGVMGLGLTWLPVRVASGPWRTHCRRVSSPPRGRGESSCLQAIVVKGKASLGLGPGAREGHQESNRW